MLKAVRSARMVVLLGFVYACGGSRFESGGSGGSAGNASGGSSAGKGGAASGGSSTGSGGASGGTAGSAGAGACIPSGPCSPEGSICSEAGCCPCSYTCQNGSWSIAACPDCALPSCPLYPPGDGDSCDACLAPVGSDCTWDQCAELGQRITATCNGNVWSSAVETCSGVACCDSDDQCAPEICVNTMCVEPMPGSCWRDEDCGADGGICSGVAVCPCNADCSYAEIPGICVPDGFGCCRGDIDCPDAAPRCAAGVCRALPALGMCWSDRDCPGQTCMIDELCVCGQTCTGVDPAGTCG